MSDIYISNFYYVVVFFFSLNIKCMKEFCKMMLFCYLLFVYLLNLYDKFLF